MRWMESTVVFVIVLAVAAGVGLSTRIATLGRAPERSPAPSAPVPPRPLAEAHWLGIETIPLTPKLARELGRDAPNAAPRSGVVIDQVTWPADAHGFAGGDVIVRLAGIPTPSLAAFIAATDRIRDRRETTVDINRQGRSLTLPMTASRLGIANGETAPEIRADAVPPHGCAAAHAALLHLDAIGPCEQCHAIRSAALPPTDLVGVLPATTQPAGPLDPLCRNPVAAR